jgi:hypothetical protein
VALAVLSLSPAEFTTARIFFILSATILGVMAALWAAKTDAHWVLRLLVCVPIFLVIGFLLPETLRWITRREVLAAQLPPPTTKQRESNSTPPTPASKHSDSGFRAKVTNRLFIEIGGNSIGWSKIDLQTEPRYPIGEQGNRPLKAYVEGRRVLR